MTRKKKSKANPPPNELSRPPAAISLFVLGNTGSTLIRTLFLHELDALEYVAERIVRSPTDDVAAEKHRQELYLSRASRSMGEDPDVGGIMEAAYDEGIAFRLTVRGLQHSIAALLTAGLYHQAEQNLRRLWGKAFTLDWEARSPGLGTVASDFEALGIKMSDFATWSEMEDLRLICNLTKHSESSADMKTLTALRARRPSLFRDPELTVAEGTMLAGPAFAVPLVGEGLFVTADDLRGFVAVVRRFWQEFADTIDRVT